MHQLPGAFTHLDIRPWRYSLVVTVELNKKTEYPHLTMLGSQTVHGQHVTVLAKNTECINDREIMEIVLGLANHIINKDSDLQIEVSGRYCSTMEAEEEIVKLILIVSRRPYVLC